MEKIKHTPGPWGMENNNDGRFLITYGKDDQGLIAEVGWQYGTVSEDRKEANARLIHACPDMLLALKEAAVVLNDIADIYKLSMDVRHKGVMKNILAAIKKAEG